AQIRVVETTAMTVPATFVSTISSQTGVSVVRSEPIDEYAFNYWKGKAGAPRYVIVADQESFMPYAAVYAHRQSSAFVNTYAEAERLVTNDGDIASIVYLGTSATTQASLASLASTKGKTMQQATSLDAAMTMLTPARLASTQSIVTFIHSADTSALTSSQQYWKIAPIYAAFRSTMLVTVTGSTAADVDASINAKLNSIVVPNNGGADPGYLVMAGHWAVFPYRFSDPRFSYMLSADARYADRNNDGDYVPEIPFGRITAYDIGNAVLLMNKGLFFDSGAMKRGSKGVLASDWLVERETDTIAALQTMYGAANVYARGDIEFSNSLTNNPPLSEVLTQAKAAEVVILTGHGNPNYLAATNPATTGQSIKNYKFYPPSFWWFNGCDTGSYYAYSTSLVSGALASGAVNIMATVDTTATHSSALRWYPGFLAQGRDIGSMIQLGLKNCESYYGSALNVNKLPQVYLIGDPLVNYPPAGAPPANEPPATPAIPAGPTEGQIGIEYVYSTSATDTDSAQLMVTFDWGDGNTSAAGPVGPGQAASAGHAWATPGTYAVKAKATDDEGDSSGWSAALSVTIAPPPPETPWQDNDSGTLYTGRDWDYTLGYEFRPTANGTVTELGGRFNGTKAVKLWDANGNLLASASVTSSDDWSYVPLATPVKVTAGRSYKVTVYTQGTGATYARYIEALPQTYGEITIESSCFKSGNAFPTLETTQFMFGQVDIVFVPDGTGA
ncbi:MAG: DUF4082 domain-containing protein, partial [Chloroflexi bacterium]|nr:DUF4082 domain-containing protein [Chloroflexota bacterium]